MKEKSVLVDDPQIWKNISHAVLVFAIFFAGVVFGVFFVAQEDPEPAPSPAPPGDPEPEDGDSLEGVVERLPFIEKEEMKK